MTSPHQPAYRPDIDGLRAVAVIAVVLFHGFPEIIRGGFIGVDIFFVISGYLISSILIKEHNTGKFTYKSFYTRRIRRIFPALIFLMSILFAINWFFLFPDELVQFGKHVISGGLFSANLMFWSEAGYFDQDSGQKMLLHLWSLGIEEQFYIFWPILLGLLWKRRWVATGVAVFIILSFITNILLIHFNQTAAFYFPFSRFWELLAGSLLAWQQLRYPLSLQRYTHLQSIAGALLITAGLLFITEKSLFPGYWAMLPVIGSILLINAGPQAAINRWILSPKAMVWFGLISYPLYLWHWPVMAFIRLAKNDTLSHAYAWRAIVISVLLAWLTYRFVESPLRKNPSAAWKTKALIVAMACIIIIGGITIIMEGFPHRKAATSANPVLLAQIQQHKEIYKQQDQCISAMKVSASDAENIICLSTSPAPKIAIIGDSHSTSFQIAALLHHETFDSVSLAQNACLPFANFTTRLPTENSTTKKCRESTRIALETLANKPEISTVILVNRGSLYFTGSGFGIEGKIDFRLYDANEQQANSREAFLTGYTQTIQQLQKEGKRVIFMLEWPELGIDPKGCAGSRLLNIDREKAAPSSCLISRKAVDARQAEYRSLVKELTRRNPELEIYDPLPLFCDTHSCRGMRGDHMYYIDDDHLSILGSQMVIQDFKHWLKTHPSMP